jgi:hypothetical protein
MKQNNLRLIYDILARPDAFFQKMGAGVADARSLIVSYGAPLFVLAAAGRMTRIMLIRASEDVVLPGDQLAGIFIITLVGYALSVWFGSYIISRLAKSFQTDQNRDNIMLLIMLAYTPFMLTQPLSAISPVMNPLLVAGLVYTVFLFGKGAGPMLGTPGNKVVGFTLVSYFIILSISHISMLLLSELIIFAV